jgi:hypothetical protein
MTLSNDERLRIKASLQLKAKRHPELENILKTKILELAKSIEKPISSLQEYHEYESALSEFVTALYNLINSNPNEVQETLI